MKIKGFFLKKKKKFFLEKKKAGGGGEAFKGYKFLAECSHTINTILYKLLMLLMISG